MQAVHDVADGECKVADAFRVVVAMEKHRNQKRLLIRQLSLHEAGQVVGDFLLACVHVFFAFFQLVVDALVLLVVFAVEAEGAIDHGPGLCEHHLESGGRLGEGDGRRCQKMRFQILEMDFFGFDGNEFLADFHENGDERDEKNACDDVENRIGIGDETACGSAF